MPESSIKTHRALKWRPARGGAADSVIEMLAVEEPLEIRLGGRRFTLTMRTPGHDEELAAGFLLAEGFINSRAELGEVRVVHGSKGEPEPNAIDVILSVPAAGLRERLKRNFTISSSCGVCGKTSIESIHRRIAPLAGGPAVPAAAILSLPHQMRQGQQVFSTTGGLHAAALFRVDQVADAKSHATQHPAPYPVAGDSRSRPRSLAHILLWERVGVRVLIRIKPPPPPHSPQPARSSSRCCARMSAATTQWTK